MPLAELHFIGPASASNLLRSRTRCPDDAYSRGNYLSWIRAAGPRTPNFMSSRASRGPKR